MEVLHVEVLALSNSLYLIVGARYFIHTYMNELS